MMSAMTMMTLLVHPPVLPAAPVTPVQAMTDRLASLGPELALGIGACLCLAFGLARQSTLRRLTPCVAGLAMIIAGLLAIYHNANPGQPFWLLSVQFSFLLYVKLAVVAVGLLLLFVAARVPTDLPSLAAMEQGKTKFDPSEVLRGEFLAFFLMSLAGVMLCAGAPDLAWLFLALELTSLPTYVMVAVSREKSAAQESAVKYFFLGAASAAIFLYGFTLIYGATGFTNFAEISSFVQSHPNDLPVMFYAGLILAIVGISFKIAAVPMHFYVADVYQGAASSVSAFLAFVPKTAGFVSLAILLSLVGWPLPAPIAWILWIMAALTMTVGNVLGLLQTNIKRMLGYSSIAHSGYMLVALLAGPATGADGSFTAIDGLSAVLFYLVAYSLSNLAAFAVIGSLKTHGEESQEIEDLSGLSRRHPALAAIMLISMFSLIGLPPLVGFTGKIYLFGSIISRMNGNPIAMWLVVIGVINSAISAVYYLRVVSACYFGQENTHTDTYGAKSRQAAGAFAAIMAIFLGVSGGWLVELARESGRIQSQEIAAEPEQNIDTTPGLPVGMPCCPPDGAAATDKPMQTCEPKKPAM